MQLTINILQSSFYFLVTKVQNIIKQDRPGIKNTYWSEINGEVA